MSSRLKKFIKNPLLIFETLGHHGMLRGTGPHSS